MSYNKKTWVSKEVITKEALNNIEEGIATLDENQENFATKEEIPSIEGLATEEYVDEEIAKIDITNQLSDYAKKSELPTKISELTNDSGYLTEIPSDYVTETELNAKGYLTEHQDISGKADKTELHSHNNKTVLDGITSAKITSWDNKSTFSGSYNDLTDKPTIPSIEGLATKEEIPSIEGLATEEYVDNAINNIDTSNLVTEEEFSQSKSDIEAIIRNNSTIGYVDNRDNNAIGITDLSEGTYTLRYINNDGVLSNYSDIGTIEADVFNRDLIAENIPPHESTRIGAYDDSDNLIGTIPLYYFKKERGTRLYSFGALSDVHNQTDESAEPTADLQRALSLFNEREDVVFTCISGDITQTATEAEYQIFQSNIQTCSPDTPVYSTPGNHDCYGSGLDLTLWKEYTDCERTYEITHNNDHFLFLGMNQWSMGSSTCTPYLTEDLEWLSEKLETYRNERCFIFTHLFFPEYAGNFKEIYPSSNWLLGTQHDFLEDLLNHYPNTIWFSGHSHWKWYLQKYEDNANIERIGGWTVHLPSCASPIDSDGISTRVNKPLESEGAIIDVYEDYIDIRGIDLKNNMYISTAKYRLDTKLVEVQGKVCKVTLNLSATIASNATNQVAYGESYTNTISTTSEGKLCIKVTMGGIDITSTALNDNNININEVTGDIVITVFIIEEFSTNLLETCEVQLNKRWSSSSGGYVDAEGTIAFSVPFEDIDGRTIKMIGFTEENEGTSTWYTYDSSGATGRIEDASGTVWTSSALIDNEDGSYDIPVSKEIFINYSNGNALTTTPDTVYITMHVQDTKLTSLDGLMMLVSDAEEEPEEPEVIYTNLLETCDVQLNKRWSSSSNAYSTKIGTIAFSVPFEDIDGRTMKLIGFTEENEGTSTWYAYDASGTTVGRIANASNGIVWNSTSLVDNGDGSYDIAISKELFMKINIGDYTVPLTENPKTIYITMHVQDTNLTSLDGLMMLVSD